MKCSHEHTLFVKNESGGKLLIVSRYMDDLIYTENDVTVFETFKHSIKGKFAMTDLGNMRYFLGVEVKQDDQGIFIGQSKYATKILTRLGMENCNMVYSPIVIGRKLVKDETEKAVDAIKYKQMVGCLM
ncbi:putative RNA-directed DNA polymerase [Medicago truncatula]|uniref:Putative RNA-directed DNA polymerase n=1 Tax=Medicago truncatula TaxID=3880 RepID=A0A396HNR0_MEDTR|nr:putative RNA-directed DNA polymerase [Medicago truncatula]